MSIEKLRSERMIGNLEFALAKRLGSLFKDTSETLEIAVALTARAVSEGHACLRLDDPDPVWKAHVDPQFTPTAQLTSPAIGTRDPSNRPLILDGQNLYLRRYWRYESMLIDALQRRLQAQPPLDDAMEALLARWFEPGANDLQRQAVRSAIGQKLTLISGGPGTGKTTTVVKLIAALQAQALSLGQPPLRLLLTAPTGKAALRLVESIRSQKEKLDLDPNIKELIPDEASTLHRALGTLPDVRSSFRYHKDNPLPIDGIVIDECSMVDLSLIARTLDAVPHDARIILLGDKDQLASVEAGAIFGDLCLTQGRLQQHVTQLTKSWRFDDSQGIGRLAHHIRDGDPNGTMDFLEQTLDNSENVTWIPIRDVYQVGPRIARILERGFEPLWAATTSQEALSAFSRFRILCAHRRGPLSVEELNQTAGDIGSLQQGRQKETWYRGRPILITENAPDSQLYNGDTGIAWPSDNHFRIHFDGNMDRKDIATSRLPKYETAYAMTVHKSQGSEFDEVLVVLPPEISPLMTRELLYTAITRARKRVVIAGSAEGIRAAVCKNIHRASGLRDRLERLNLL